MRPTSILRAVAALALALAMGACTDDDGPNALDFGPASQIPSPDAPDAGAGPDGGPAQGAPSAACVERPPTGAEAPRAPGAGLPCELIPPGFVAPR